mmetsp:Transcript_6550/g.14220  ORF Transcript_6550/g.14220 Transcript_6550/m.14220 type:complete len:498 (-) Transcript_6550:38-1531(-)
MNKGDEKVNLGLWEQILKEVDTQSRMPDKTLLMFGRAGIGKRTLLQGLLQHACPAAAAADAAADTNPEGHSRAIGLDYAYFGARDPEQDENASAPDYVCPAACSVLILEELKHEPVLKSRLSADMLKHAAAVICLDLKAPWTMMEDLRQWLEVLQRLTSEMTQQLPLGEQDQLRERVVSTIANFKEADDTSEVTETGSASLVYNMGIPIVVVVTRADGASNLDSQKTAGWSETIEAYLRNECLSYGAALVYTMCQAKNARNVDLLFDYLMNRLYAFPLKTKAQVPSRDALFVPTGWDTQTKVDQAASQLPGGGGLDRSFESIVISLEPPPPTPPAVEECEDMPTFLRRHAAILQKLGGGSGATRKSVAMAQDGGEARRTSTAVAARRTSKDSQAAAGNTDNAALANFFQNLLTRNSGSAPPPDAATIAAAGGTPAPAAPAAAAPEAGGAAAPPAPEAAAPAPAISVSTPEAEKPAEKPAEPPAEAPAAEKPVEAAAA